MNFEARTNAIGALLRDTILPRFKRPDHLSTEAARAELSDMVADLNAAWPIMSAERFEATAREMARIVRTTSVGRTWPTIGLMIKALRAALAPDAGAKPDAGATRLDVLEIRRIQLERWCRGEANCPEHLITAANLGALAADGIIQRSQIEDMLAYATTNVGVAVEDGAEQRGRRDRDGITIAVKRMPGAGGR